MGSPTATGLILKSLPEELILRSPMATICGQKLRHLKVEQHSLYVFNFQNKVSRRTVFPCDSYFKYSDQKKKKTKTFTGRLKMYYMLG